MVESRGYEDKTVWIEFELCGLMKFELLHVVSFSFSSRKWAVAIVLGRDRNEERPESHRARPGLDQKFHEQQKFNL